ncbi:hypothetical protein [Thermoanaerobaculum aquaticum]|uniref:hypothetical protein n=1 Tax=Thermoanaerobaculum aquaticum TaxID=1312852 RepID=UPI0013784D0E|nr:hypothetical protein [Thermoanaerobaculum aquaticum]
MGNGLGKDFHVRPLGFQALREPADLNPAENPGQELRPVHGYQQDLVENAPNPGCKLGVLVLSNQKNVGEEQRFFKEFSFAGVVFSQAGKPGKIEDQQVPGTVHVGWGRGVVYDKVLAQKIAQKPGIFILLKAEQQARLLLRW